MHFYCIYVGFIHFKKITNTKLYNHELKNKIFSYTYSVEILIIFLIIFMLK